MVVMGAIVVSLFPGFGGLDGVLMRDIGGDDGGGDFGM